MKKIIFLFFAFLITFSSAIAQSRSSSDVYVRGYTRKDGTVVPGHYRSAPNSTNRDNFSTRGNTNPYTGKKGWIAPDNKTYTTKSSDYYSSSGYSSSSSYSSSSGNSFGSNKKYTNEELAKRIKAKFKAKHPEYSDMEDDNLVKQIIKKYPVYSQYLSEEIKNSSNSNFAKPLNIQGKNYFYALEKRYIGLPMVFYRKKGKIVGPTYNYRGYVSGNDRGFVFCNNHGDYMRMNLGIEVDGGALIQIDDSDIYRYGGDIIFYLENGDVIKCFDRGIKENINNEYYRYYKLTRDEVHKLENYNIEIIDIKKSANSTLRFDRHKLQTKTRFDAPEYNDRHKLNQVNVSDILKKFFEPYWEKRVEKKSD